MTTKGVFDTVFTEPNQEFTVTGIVAKASGTQASGTPLTGAVNRITTCATAADSVVLPVSAPGLRIVVINSGATSAQVYGAGTDTINGVATATGVPQPAGTTATYTCYAAGTWLSAQSVNNTGSNGLAIVPAKNAITALVGGAQGGTALTAGINRITTVTSAADSVQLPISIAGMSVTVINAAAANAVAVFGQTGDVINALSANASLSVAANKTITFFCAVAGTWNSQLTA